MSLPRAERTSTAALALADVGAGLYLVGAGVDVATPVHVVVGVLALVLAVPAAVTALTGRLVWRADVAVLVNVGALAFVTFDVVAVTPGAVRAVGLGVLLAAVTAATGALYVRLFRGVRRGR